MKKYDQEIEFEFEIPEMVSTENEVGREILEKIYQSIVPVPGDKKIIILVLGLWEESLQTPEKWYDLESVSKDIPYAKYGTLDPCSGFCDNSCINCGVVECDNRTHACEWPKIEMINLRS